MPFWFVKYIKNTQDKLDALLKISDTTTEAYTTALAAFTEASEKTLPAECEEVNKKQESLEWLI